jgi:hypothetical protein
MTDADVDEKIEGADDGMPITVFCKGRCGGKTRQHRLTRLKRGLPGQNPGQRWYGYQATCSHCGSVATDHYNWGGGPSLSGMRDEDERAMQAEKNRRR